MENYEQVSDFHGVRRDQKFLNPKHISFATGQELL